MRLERNQYWGAPKPKHVECEINGERLPYDACARGDLEEAKQEYKAKFEYFGSGHIYYVNNVKNESTELIHFFKRKP